MCCFTFSNGMGGGRRVNRKKISLLKSNSLLWIRIFFRRDVSGSVLIWIPWSEIPYNFCIYVTIGFFSLHCLWTRNYLEEKKSMAVIFLRLGSGSGKSKAGSKSQDIAVRPSGVVLVRWLATHRHASRH